MSCSSFATIVEPPHAPARAGELTLDSPIRCSALHATLSAACCATRQAVSERQRTQDRWRGQGSEFPSCTERCAQGAAIREALGSAGPTWSGAGPGRRFARERRNRAAQAAARRRLRLVGLLEPVPSQDEPPDEDEAHAPP